MSETHISSQTQNMRPLKNAGLVGIGKGAQGVVSLIALALSARQLTPEVFGFFVLIHGMVFGLSQILRFQTWQAVLETNDKPRLGHLIRFGFTLDLLAAVVGGVVMVALAAPLARSFELPEDQIWMAQLYSASIVLMLMTPTQLGVLRLFDRFDLVAIQTAIGPLIRFFGVVYLFVFMPDAGLAEYLIVWFIGSLIARQAMMVMAQRELKKQGFGAKSFLPVNPFKPKEHKIWSFIMGHNIYRSFYISHEQIGLLVVGALLGPAAAGVFKIAQKFASILIKPTEKLLVPALYPEMAKFQASGDMDGRRHMIRSNMMVIGGITSVLFVVLYFAGPWLIHLFAGNEYAGAYIPMIWLCVAGIAMIAFYPFEPLLSAAGAVRYLVLAYGLGLAVYGVALYGLIPLYDITGAALAALLAAMASGIVMIISFRFIENA